MILHLRTREPDPGIIEGVCSIIHAAPRTEIKGTSTTICIPLCSKEVRHTELHILRDILMHKYGREFSIAVMENRDGCVTDRVSRKRVFLLASSNHPDDIPAKGRAQVGDRYAFARVSGRLSRRNFQSLRSRMVPQRDNQ